MHNRYPFELLALQTYMYLLYARDNYNEYTLARKKTICEKLRCKLPELNKAITYLVHIGLLDKVIKKAVEKYPLELFHDSYYFYMTKGGISALTYRRQSKSLSISEKRPAILTFPTPYPTTSIYHNASLRAPLSRAVRGFPAEAAKLPVFLPENAP
ncbi:Uncharacterised protein [Kluyvera cryocrescens]|uniref:Uncharacterized protein n=1 Tax=Kluyvera cryocrescens TaxID=580 RepID=A0A485D5M8_KLUCR|nr:Uncharacterised protein [Kluyvera cryocrescens]